MKVAAALTVLALASTCVAVDAVKVTADGQIECAGRFIGKKRADCDVGSLSRIVMHLGSGIAIQQGLLRQDEELDALVDRMMSDRPDADAAADVFHRTQVLDIAVVVVRHSFVFPWRLIIPHNARVG